MSEAKYGETMVLSIVPVFRFASYRLRVGFKVDLMRCIIIS
ncbi:hypothetical protein [Coxiella burnetii]